MPTLSAVRKAQAEVAVLDATPTLDVENLNPRSHAVKNLEMVVRRSLMLEELCVQHLDRCDGDLERARTTDPLNWGSIDKVARSTVSNPKTLVRDIFGDTYWTHPEYRSWNLLVDAWYSGSLRRQREAVVKNLPQAIRKKYE